MCAFASRCMLSTVMLLAVCALEARFCQPLIPFPKGCSVLCSYGLVSQNVRCFQVSVTGSCHVSKGDFLSVVFTSVYLCCMSISFSWQQKCVINGLFCLVRTVLFWSWRCQLKLLNLCALSYSGSRGPVHCRTPEVLPREEGTVGAGMQAEREHHSACRWCVSQLLSAALRPRVGS